MSRSGSGDAQAPFESDNQEYDISDTEYPLAEHDDDEISDLESDDADSHELEHHESDTREHGNELEQDIIGDHNPQDQEAINTSAPSSCTSTVPNMGTDNDAPKEMTANEISSGGPAPLVGDEGVQHSRHRWNPKFLHPATLLGFAISYAAMIAALQILYSVSQRNHGLSTTDQKLHYLWTYGPTTGKF